MKSNCVFSTAITQQWKCATETSDTDSIKTVVLIKITLWFVNFLYKNLHSVSEETCRALTWCKRSSNYYIKLTNILFSGRHQKGGICRKIHVLCKNWSLADEYKLCSITGQKIFLEIRSYACTLDVVTLRKYLAVALAWMLQQNSPQTADTCCLCTTYICSLKQPFWR